MNFIYIHTHDSGRCIQPYGIAAQNPSLMALANEGAVFRNMHCAAPTCSPSRAAMLTGMAPHCNGMLGLAHRGFKLNSYSRHIASYLSENGYHTALCGIQHECADEPSCLGYSEVYRGVGQGSAMTDRSSLEKAKNFLMSYGKRDCRKPFFMSFGMLSTHRPFEKAHTGDGSFLKPVFPVADTAENREDWNNYLESLSTADYCVGELTDTLRKAGLYDDTAVLFTTDHGPAYPDMKCSLYDTGTGVAFILRIPGERHSVCDALCSQLDFYPTICELLGVPEPDWVQGKSLMPLVRKETEEINKYIFSEINFHASYQPARCVRSREYKLIRFYDGGEMTKLPNIDTSCAKTLAISRPLFNRPHQKEMFFDLIADPGERTSVLDTDEYREQYIKHSKALDEQMLATNDPLVCEKSIFQLGAGTKTDPFDAKEPDIKHSYVIKG